jgi:hypothetical protein
VDSLDAALIAFAIARRDEITSAAGGANRRSVEAAIIVGIDAGIRLAAEWPIAGGLSLGRIHDSQPFAHPEIQQARASDQAIAALVKATR